MFNNSFFKFPIRRDEYTRISRFLLEISTFEFLFEEIPTLGQICFLVSHLIKPCGIIAVNADFINTSQSDSKQFPSRLQLHPCCICTNKGFPNFFHVSLSAYVSRADIVVDNYDSYCFIHHVVFNLKLLDIE